MIEKRSGIKVVNWIQDLDYFIIKNLIGLNKMDSHQVIDMERIIRKYIDSKCTICRHCPAQVKFAHKRLVNWWDLVGQNLAVRNEKGQYVKID
jgi:hypothetical protein